MITPLQFMTQYRNIEVKAPLDDPAARMCRVVTHRVQLLKYFMMDWTEGSEERRDYGQVSAGSNDDLWFKANKEFVRNAAMGKGSPRDYALALEWAIRSKKLPLASRATLQAYLDEYLGIDCSGFVTNYLIACGKKTYSEGVVRNTSAASYFSTTQAVNDATQVQQGDLLVWMHGNDVKRNPGHVALVESYVPQSRVGGNLHVVEATGASAASPKLVDSMYSVERIIEKGADAPVMVLVVRRHGLSGDRVAVIRL